MELTDELQKLRESTPDVDLVLRVFEEADRVNTEAQIAMGQRMAIDPSPVASTSVVVTFAPDISAGEHPDIWR